MEALLAYGFDYFVCQPPGSWKLVVIQTLTCYIYSTVLYEVYLFIIRRFVKMPDQSWSDIPLSKFHERTGTVLIKNKDVGTPYERHK